MISYLNGKILAKNDTSITLLTYSNSIGFLININSSLLEDKKTNDELSLFIKTIVKENDISLYGFITNEQMILFEHLLSVNGVGPKAAMNIISYYDTEIIISEIMSEKTDKLSKIKGLGSKTAEKIVFSLKDKFKKEYTITNKTSSNDNIDLVIQSMMALGYDKKTSLDAANNTYNIELSIQENITNALKFINKK